MSRNARTKDRYARYLISICAMGGLCAFSPPGVGADLFTTIRSGPQARVVIVEDPQATESFRAKTECLLPMVERGITGLTGKSTAREAWLSLVSTQDIVGIKVYSPPGPNSGTRPEVTAAVVQSLLAAGLPTNHIIVWDKSEEDLRLSGYFALGQRLGIRVAGSRQAGYDETNFYDRALIGNLIFGDAEFGKTTDGAGRKSFVSKLVCAEMTKIISLTPLLNHTEAGVSGNLYGLAMGSVDNAMRFEISASRLATAVPEIYALPVLADRVVLNMVDALICQYEGGPRGLLHYSKPMNQLRFSRDPVALDILSIKELDRQRLAARAPFVKSNLELYQNAALMDLGVGDPRRIQVEVLR